MGTFGKSIGGGRRKALRASTPLLAVISTVGGERRVGVINASHCGVQLTSPDLPNKGEVLMFRSEAVEAYGQVVWCRSGQCGVAFADPISDKQVEQLRREAKIAADLPHLTFGRSYGKAA